ncbi:MAG: cytochrome c [Anaerolineae bacterium]|nr:cytochrome c [Anaerolineae bacterium]
MRKLLSMKILRLLCLGGVLFILSACGGLGGEPRIIATIPPPTAAPTSAAPLAPSVPPDVALGAQVFTQNCTRCHGTGMGDGELVRNGQLPTPPPMLRDPLTAREQSPADYFATITNGRIDKLMPPWGVTLTETERWAAALFTYTLAYTPEQIARGQALIESAGVDVSDLSDLAASVQLSQQALAQELQTRLGTAATEDQGWDAAAYVRSLTVANPASIGQAVTLPVTTEEASSAAPTVAGVTGRVTGRVTNGTAGGSVPADLQVNLLVTQNGQLVDQGQTTLSADGTYTFEGTLISAEADYITAVIYRDRIFSSPPQVGDPNSPTVDLPLTIYELTEDPAVLSISRMVTQVRALGNTLQIQQAILYSNSSDRAFTSSTALGNGRFASVVLGLPPGAQIISYDDPNRYVFSEENYTVIDSSPVYPGQEHLIVVVYIVPYDARGSIIEQPVTYAVEGPVRLLISPQELTVTSDQLPSIGPQTLAPGAEEVFAGYGATLSLPAGNSLRFEISGAAAPGPTLGDTPVAVPTSNLLPVLLIGIGLCALAVAGLLIWRSRVVGSKPNPQALIDALVKQIAELDDDHKAGRLNHDVWHRQRAQLKARLAELLGEGKPE